jgi:hypothetical protein
MGSGADASDGWLDAEGCPVLFLAGEWLVAQPLGMATNNPKTMIDRISPLLADIRATISNLQTFPDFAALARVAALYEMEPQAPQAARDEFADCCCDGSGRRTGDCFAMPHKWLRKHAHLAGGAFAK